MVKTLIVRSTVTFRMGIFSNVLMILGAFGMGGSGSARLEVLGPPSHTVAPWYELLANRSKPASGPSESEFSVLNIFLVSLSV